MSKNTESTTPLDDISAELDQIDKKLVEFLVEQSEKQAKHAPNQSAAADTASGYHLPQDNDSLRQLVERFQGSRLDLTVLEHLTCLLGNMNADRVVTIHMDGSADLMEMVDLARFYFGFSAELLPASDAADVAGAVDMSKSDIGLIALSDRAELPWWRGLNDAGTQISGRLPLVILEERPADLPALVLSKTDSLVDKTDIAVYDARWSDLLPGRLMDQGIEVLSFFRSANGVDALIAVSGDLPEEDVLMACAAAGAAPEVLRRVGGFFAPLDGNTDPDDVFDPEEQGFED